MQHHHQGCIQSQTCGSFASKLVNKSHTCTNCSLIGQKSYPEMMRRSTGKYSITSDQSSPVVGLATDEAEARSVKLVSRPCPMCCHHVRTCCRATAAQDWWVASQKSIISFLTCGSTAESHSALWSVQPSHCSNPTPSPSPPSPCQCSRTGRHCGFECRLQLCNCRGLCGCLLPECGTVMHTASCLLLTVHWESVMHTYRSYRGLRLRQCYDFFLKQGTSTRTSSDALMRLYIPSLCSPAVNSMSRWWQWIH